MTSYQWNHPNYLMLIYLLTVDHLIAASARLLHLSACQHSPSHMQLSIFSFEFSLFICDPTLSVLYSCLSVRMWDKCLPYIFVCVCVCHEMGHVAISVIIIGKIRNRKKEHTLALTEPYCPSTTCV